MDEAKYKAEDVAKYILYELNKKNKKVNHLKLQKLLYYSQAWNLVFLEKPLFNEEFEAWVHGPVVREVWNCFKSESVLFNDIENIEEVDVNFSDDEKDVINDVLSAYGSKSGYYLEALTHQEKPWMDAYKKGKNTVISKEEIREFYTKKYYGEKEA